MADANDQNAFEDAIRALQTEVSTSGAFLTVDAAARHAYGRQIAAMAASLRAEVSAGTITWAQAAAQAQEARNVIMELLRGRSTPIGRAVAEAMKMKGRTLNDLVAHKTRELYGPRVDFTRLSATSKDRVYAEIVKSAGKSNPRISLAMQRLSYAGRSLLFVSLAMSVYSVSTAENKTAAVGRELTVTGAGIAGGAAGGAVAGLACGPGAPVCVTVGAFVGGALAAFLRQPSLVSKGLGRWNCVNWAATSWMFDGSIPTPTLRRRKVRSCYVVPSRGEQSLAQSSRLQ